MKFTVQREAILKPLQRVIGAVEKRHTIPILANVLLDLSPHLLSITATDMEIELIGQAELISVSEPGIVTVSARKLLDICRSLPEQSILEFSLTELYIKIKAGRSLFNLSLIPPDDFPN